ncbi:GGDEF domain-containing protein [Shewanella sedimentimangrovi]|uniref:diguanylate cyclase n=1 Tax=Shewanella sedimentimangrovi TaxID=2814293 RepID=A0ABX7R095_9GAMM|nr:GGDEF domain-containing protein [Shewanella sedimentimangrovi]QSX37186.1 diguanylate cyclase [Shewanella sedimentimangrovi]
MDIQAQTLFRVIILLLATASLAWTVMAYPLRIAPRASWRYAGSYALMILGLLLAGQRQPEASYLYWFSADVLVLSGLLCLRWGTLQLFHLDSGIKLDVLVLLCIAGLMLLVPPSAESLLYLGSLFSLAAAWLLWRLAQANIEGLRISMSSLRAILFVSPIILASLSFVVRLGVILWFGQQGVRFVSLDTAEAVPMLWFYLILTLVISIITIINAITRLVTKIRYLADRDLLTGLWNRRSSVGKHERLHQAWERGEAPVYSLILMDLDHFKQVNDTYGHLAGDEALRQTALLLQRECRRDDVLCRFGGEEFLLLLPNTDARRVRELAETLRQVLMQNPLRWKDQLIPLSGSFGCATVRGGLMPTELLETADRALYQAKDAGRNCIGPESNRPIEAGG